MIFKKLKKDCSRGFHDFKVPYDQWELPIWLVSVSCTKCGISRTKYDHTIEVNGDDDRIRHERKMEIISHVACTCFFLLFVGVLIFTFVQVGLVK